MLTGEMNANELGERLHDKATRGAPLTGEEQSQLQTWYAQQDAAETGSLIRASSREDVSRLRGQVQAALTQLGTVTHQIQEIAAGNETLRNEVAALRRRAARLPAPQAA